MSETLFREDAKMKRGDIVELKLLTGDDFENQNKYKALLALNPEKLIILRRIDETSFLVALGKHSQIKTTLSLPTNQGDLYIYVKQFYAVEECFLKSCDTYFGETFESVSSIYNFHNQYIELRKARTAQKLKLQRQKREQQNAKIKKRKEDKANQRKLEQQYKVAYDNAVINNDRQSMKTIEAIVGCAPCQSGKGYSTSSCSRKTSAKYFNPKPMSGGRFTPK